MVELSSNFSPLGDKKTHPEEIPSQERFSFYNPTFAGRLFGLSSSRKGTFLA